MTKTKKTNDLKLTKTNFRQKTKAKSISGVSIITAESAVKQLLTVDKFLLLLGADADQVSIELLTALLSIRPGISLRKVKVTAAHELQPAFGTALYRYTHTQTDTSKHI